jgi:hypothetical protein
MVMGLAPSLAACLVDWIMPDKNGCYVYSFVGVLKPFRADIFEVLRMVAQ